MPVSTATAESTSSQASLEKQRELFPADSKPTTTCYDFAVLCAGLDQVRRGYETHTRTLFDALAKEKHPHARFTLFKRSGPRISNEISLHTPFRGGFLCRGLALVKGDPLFWEGVLFAITFVTFSAITRRCFRKLILIEPVVAKAIHRLRAFLPGNPRLLFTHGVCNPPSDYAPLADEIHEVNIENHSRLEKYLEETGKHLPHALLPHFIGDEIHRHDKEELRRRYGITTPQILLSVGAIEGEEKRMDYIIAEATRLGPEWTLVLCGKAVDQELLDTARRKLGTRFVHLYIDHDRIEEVYRLADVFVTASLNEGFGIVILEAMRAELPVIAHDRALYRWILKSDATCIDLEKPTELSRFLERSPTGWLSALGARNRTVFEHEYTWANACNSYYDLFLRVPVPPAPPLHPPPCANPITDFLARQYHRISSPNILRKIRRRLARRACNAFGLSYLRPGDIIPNISEIASCAVPRTTAFIAHPDDEIFCSGLLCELSRRGADVTLCCFTRGEGGMTGDHSRDQLGAVRENELREAARHLGIEDVRFLNYVDPEATAYRTYAPTHEPAELRKRITDILSDTEPRIVLTHGSCGEYWHPAHILLHKQVRSSVKKWNESQTKGTRLLTFNAWREDHVLEQYLNEGDTTNFMINATEFHQPRLQSIAEHATQREVFEIFANGSVDDFIAASSIERYHVVI